MLQKIDTTQDCRFSDIWSLYTTSFSDDRKRNWASQRDIMKKPNYALYADVLDGNGGPNTTGVQGLLATWTIDAGCFIEHFAIRHHLKGKELETKVLSEFLKTVTGTAVLQTEPSTDATKDQALLYEKAGFVANGFGYVQPALGVGKKTVNLVLLSRPTILTRDEFENVRAQIHKKAYGLSDAITKM